MPASYEQGFNSRAKQSTRYFATGASITACNTDVSQYLTNMTAGVGCVFEATSARFNYSHPRTILVRAETNNTDTEILFTHGSAGTLERLRFSAANTITVTVAGAVVLTYTVTGLGASRENLIVAWTSIANPDTTGASDAVLSWLHVWNTADGTYDKTRFTHAIKASVSATALFGAGTTAGVQAFSGTIIGLLYENRCMSATEIAADWVTSLSVPSTALETSTQGLPPSSSTIERHNYHHGPAAVWACDATRRMQRRTLSALVNERCRVRPSWQTTTLDGPFVRQVQDDTVYRMLLGTLKVCPVPDTANVLWVRMHARCWTTSGAAVPTGLRVYSMNQLPTLGGGAQSYEQFFVGTSVTRDDDASVGSWSVLGLLSIARGTTGIRRGKTYLVAAVAIDPTSTSANDANARVAINAIHVVPGFLDGSGQFGEVMPP